MIRQLSKPLDHIKPRSSLPHVGCARGANTFPSHNQSLTRESLTKTNTFGFPSNPEPNIRCWLLKSIEQMKKTSSTPREHVRQAIHIKKTSSTSRNTCIRWSSLLLSYHDSPISKLLTTPNSLIINIWNLKTAPPPLQFSLGQTFV